MSTKPGVTRSPSASMVRAAVPAGRSGPSPTATITPPRTATSAGRAGAPVPSSTAPPFTSRSKSVTWFPLWSRLVRAVPAECGQDLGGEEALGGAGLVAVGPEGGAGDDEALDAEVGQRPEALDAAVGRADDGEAVDEPV